MHPVASDLFGPCFLDSCLLDSCLLRVAGLQVAGRQVVGLRGAGFWVVEGLKVAWSERTQRGAVLSAPPQGGGDRLDRVLSAPPQRG